MQRFFGSAAAAVEAIESANPALAVALLKAAQYLKEEGDRAWAQGDEEVQRGNEELGNPDTI